MDTARLGAIGVCAARADAEWIRETVQGKRSFQLEQPALTGSCGRRLPATRTQAPGIAFQSPPASGTLPSSKGSSPGRTKDHCLAKKRSIIPKNVEAECFVSPTRFAQAYAATAGIKLRA
jgi:hypothetical protein